MMYVQRDESGAIKGVFANPQPQANGTCLTEPKPLPDDDPEVVSFINRKIVKSISDGQLAAILVQQKIIPQAVIDSAIAAQTPEIATS